MASAATAANSKASALGRAARGQGLIGGDAGGKPYQRQERVDGPDERPCGPVASRLGNTVAPASRTSG